MNRDMPSRRPILTDAHIDEPSLIIPIRVHWSLAVLVGLFNAFCIVMLVGEAMGTFGSNPPGIEWLGALLLVSALIAVDALVLPMFRNPRVQFDEDRLSLFLGPHKVRIPYDGIDFVSERFDGSFGSVGYAWKPTAPGAVRIHGKLWEEAVAVADKELFYQELLRRNPRIRIERGEP